MVQARNIKGSKGDKVSSFVRVQFSDFDYKDVKFLLLLLLLLLLLFFLFFIFFYFKNIYIYIYIFFFKKILVIDKSDL